MTEPLVNSPETKRLVEFAIASGASVRTAYKTVRKRLRIEARRHKEVDGGDEPEVVFDKFSQSGERGAAPAVWAVEESVAAKAAKHRRARRRSVQLQACGD